MNNFLIDTRSVDVSSPFLSFSPFITIKCILMTWEASTTLDHIIVRWSLESGEWYITDWRMIMMSHFISWYIYLQWVIVLCISYTYCVSLMNIESVTQSWWWWVNKSIRSGIYRWLIFIMMMINTPFFVSLHSASFLSWSSVAATDSWFLTRILSPLSLYFLGDALLMLVHVMIISSLHGLSVDDVLLIWLDESEMQLETASAPSEPTESAVYPEAKCTQLIIIWWWSSLSFAACRACEILLICSDD